MPLNFKLDLERAKLIHYQEYCLLCRVGLLGNPSDGYFGKALAFTLGNFACEVSLHPKDRGQPISFIPHPIHDRETYTCLEDLARTCAKAGYTGGTHLLKVRRHRHSIYKDDRDLES